MEKINIDKRQAKNVNLDILWKSFSEGNLVRHKLKEA